MAQLSSSQIGFAQDDRTKGNWKIGDINFPLLRANKNKIGRVVIEVKNGYSDSVLRPKCITFFKKSNTIL